MEDRTSSGCCWSWLGSDLARRTCWPRLERRCGPGLPRSLRSLCSPGIARCQAGRGRFFRMSSSDTEHRRTSMTCCPSRSWPCISSCSCRKFSGRRCSLFLICKSCFCCISTCSLWISRSRFSLKICSTFWSISCLWRYPRISIWIWFWRQF